MDKMTIEVLEDGQIKITTDKISMENHCSADELIEQIEKMMGGTRATTKTRQGHAHVHHTTGKKVWHKH